MIEASEHKETWRVKKPAQFYNIGSEQFHIWKICIQNVQGKENKK